MMEVGNDLSLYKYLVERKEPTTTDEAATATKCDPVLMRRILRNLAAADHVDEVDADVFVANKLTAALASPKGISGHRNM